MMTKKLSRWRDLFGLCPGMQVCFVREQQYFPGQMRLNEKASMGDHNGGHPCNRD